MILNRQVFVFYKDGKPFVRASSLRIKANSNKLLSNNCEVVVYISDNDSIFHPGLDIKYDLESLEMGRSDDGSSTGAF